MGADWVKDSSKALNLQVLFKGLAVMLAPLFVASILGVEVFFFSTFSIFLSRWPKSVKIEVFLCRRREFYMR